MACDPPHGKVRPCRCIPALSCAASLRATWGIPHSRRARHCRKPWHQREILEHHAAIGARVSHGFSLQQNLTVARLREPRDRRDQRPLAAAGESDDRRELDQFLLELERGAVYATAGDHRQCGKAPPGLSAASPNALQPCVFSSREIAAKKTPPTSSACVEARMKSAALPAGPILGLPVLGGCARNRRCASCASGIATGVPRWQTPGNPCIALLRFAVDKPLLTRRGAGVSVFRTKFVQPAIEQPR